MKYLQKVVNFPQDLEEGVVYYSTEEDMVLIKPQTPTYTIKVSANGDGCLLINEGMNGEDYLEIVFEDEDTPPYCRNEVKDFTDEGVKYYAYTYYDGDFINTVYIKQTAYGTYENVSIYVFGGDEGTTFMEVSVDSFTIHKGEAVEQTLCYTEGDNQILTADTKILSVRKIENDYEENTTLTSIEIPNSVTSIGIAAFYECTNLNSVIIPSSVVSIGHDAFSYCRNIKKIVFNEGLVTIGQGAFLLITLEPNSVLTLPSTIQNIEGCALPAVGGWDEETDEWVQTSTIKYNGTKDELRAKTGGYQTEGCGHEDEEYGLPVQCTDGELKWRFLECE